MEAEFDFDSLVSQYQTLQNLCSDATNTVFVDPQLTSALHTTLKDQQPLATADLLGAFATRLYASLLALDAAQGGAGAARHTTATAAVRARIEELGRVLAEKRATEQE